MVLFGWVVKFKPLVSCETTSMHVKYDKNASLALLLGKISTQLNKYRGLLKLLFPGEYNLEKCQIRMSVNSQS